MFRFACCGVVLIVCSLSVFASENIEPVRADSELDERKLEFNAIHSIHAHLDDDNSGDVDFKESKEFLQHELHVQDNKRHSKFHSGVGSIFVNDLWKAWLNSEGSKWTPDDVAVWLKNTVQLPQYADVFKKEKISGYHLPRLASSDDGILLNELKISNIIDRKKIALRAMDVVLFGAPRAASEDQRKLEFNAIHSIHTHLDDDKSGDVDFKESKEFLQHELHVQDNKRHSKFHSGDGSISVNDLWKAWLNSEVCKWTPDEVADWLKNTVDLPKYSEVFKKEKISGYHLPRLASLDDGVLLNKLKISNIIDRKKIALRAMDVVLFGAPRGHNYLKDLVLGLAVLIAMVGFWFSNVQKRKAQKQMEIMMKDVEYLQDAEKNLTTLQSRLHEAEASHQVIQHEKFVLESNLKTEIETAKREAQRLREAREDQPEEIHTRLKLAEEELIQVREALQKAEKELEYFSSQMTSSLQKWLEITYQQEVKNFTYRRNAALRKMKIAKEACDRINRKRNSLLGSLRLVHDQNIDEVDQIILAARSSLAEVTNELEELLHRWQQIEACCRLDLGVSSSFICDSTDAPSSPVGQAVAMCGNVGTLGSAKSRSRESLSLHRVFTYPSFQGVNDSPPPYHSISKSKVTRHTSSMSCSSEVGKVSEHENGLGGSQNGSSSEHNKTQSQSTDCSDNTGDCVHAEYEGPIAQKNVSILSNTKIKKKSCNENGTDQELKTKKRSSLNSDTKFSLHKKKWWSRNKRLNGLEMEPEFETDAVESLHGGSLPVLPQEKSSKQNSVDNGKAEHHLRTKS